MAHPIAYLLTWTTHGSWVHGDERTSVDRFHNQFNAPRLIPNVRLEDRVRSRMKSEELILDDCARFVVEEAIVAECNHRGWELSAINVRTNHVHCVVSAGDIAPEKAMQMLKSWATRQLRAQGLIGPEQSVWTRHGSTRYIWNGDSLNRAIRYVIEGQGVDLP